MQSTGGASRTMGYAGWLVGMCLFLIACNLQPSGTVIFRVEGSRTYDRANLQSDFGDPQFIHKLKWVDDNTWQTTVGLPLGRYIFQARGGDGRTYNHSFNLTAEKRFSFPALSEEKISGDGPKLSGHLVTKPGEFVPEVIIVLAGKQVALRRSFIRDERFSITAPVAGRYRVDIIIPGEKPRVATYKDVEVAADKDLGDVHPVE